MGSDFQRTCFQDLGAGTFDAGISQCQALGGHLPVVTKSTVMTFLANKFGQFWMGLKTDRLSFLPLCCIFLIVQSQVFHRKAQLIAFLLCAHLAQGQFLAITRIPLLMQLIFQASSLRTADRGLIISIKPINYWQLACQWYKTLSFSLMNQFLQCT